MLGFIPTEQVPYYFLSYNREDAPRVAEIASRLFRNGVPIWYDKGLKYGEAWEAEIAKRIMDSQAVILFFTKSILYKQKPYTQKEYRMATVNFKKKVYVVELDSIQPDEVPFDKVSWWDDIQATHTLKAMNLPSTDSIVSHILNMLPTNTDTADLKLPHKDPSSAPRERKATPIPIVSTLMSPILNRQEDNAKLTNNYEGLCLRYRKTKNLIRYDNTGKPDDAQVLKLYGKKTFAFPVTYDYALSGLTIEIADSQRRYITPEYISTHRDELIAAHNHSTVYNNLNIRIDNWYIADRQLHIETSRTSYFDSLVTNRAMDYHLASGISIRDAFEYMPQISPLKKSVLSNHIGFNGFIESSDGYIPFVKRSSTVSIGKRTIGTSVGASLKTKYALNEEGEFNIDGLLDAVQQEIFDELGISPEGLEPFSAENHHIIAAYRDLVEGGKPQFLVYVKSSHTKQEIEALFHRNSQDKVKQMLADGKQLVWVPREELKNLCITPASVIFKGTVMKMVPSATASIIMLLDYLASL